MRGFLIAAALIAAPALAQTAIDPARMEAGRALAAKTVPTGAYQKVMQGAVPGLTDGVMKQMLDLPVQQLVGLAGLSAEQARKLGSATTRQIMAIMDPAYEQRMKISMTTTFAVMGEVMGQVEPELREGLAESYAGHFTTAQLGELNAFFSTPTGSAYAAQQLTMMNDPAVMARMQKIMPMIIKQMPTIAARVQAATASLPKPKTAADLTDADRAKLAQLLGVSPDKLKAKDSAK